LTFEPPPLEPSLFGLLLEPAVAAVLLSTELSAGGLLGLLLALAVLLGMMTLPPWFAGGLSPALLPAPSVVEGLLPPAAPVDGGTGSPSHANCTVYV